MSHYTVQFTGTPTQKREQALKEVKNYLGLARYLQIAKTIRMELAKCRTTAGKLRVCYIMCDFLGIRGRYPVQAIFLATKDYVLSR